MWNVEMITLTLVVAVCLLQTSYLVNAARVWRRFRGHRVVTCPETGALAGVTIDAAHAAFTAAFGADGAVRLSGCSRWPTRGRCNEPCVPEAKNPDNTARAIAARGYAGRRCAYCHGTIGEVDFLDHYPALIDTDGRTQEWTVVPAEQLPDALRTRPLVCWNCHVAETFRRLHPELVTDR